MKAHQKTIGKNDEWITPWWIMEPLGSFDLDPCAPTPEKRPWPTADSHFDINSDGLSQKWFGRVWLNPPFNRYERPKWMSQMAEHGNGIMLLPAACETAAFQNYVFGQCSGILMLDRRPHFCDTEGREARANSGCTICLISYGDSNAKVLKDSGLGTLLKVVK